MIKFIKQLFKRPSLEELASIPKSGVLKDRDFGFISYVPPSKKEDEGFWQMYHEWEHPESNAKVGCSIIPGDDNGPFESSRKFLLSKRSQLSELWEFCHDELSKIVQEWYQKENTNDPKDIYFLSSLALEKSGGDEWEISFEAHDKYFWTFVSFQIKQEISLFLIEKY